MYKCKRFDIQELVPKSICNKYGELAWGFLDTKALMVIDTIAEAISPDHPVVINNWSSGGQYSQSGLRTVEFFNSADDYAKSMSQHKFGRAFDMKFNNGMSIEQVHAWLTKNWSKVSDIPIWVEEKDDMTWLHVDTRNRMVDSDTLIHFFKV